MSLIKHLSKISLFLFFTSPAFATGFSNHWLICQSANETISGMSYFISPPGGPGVGGNSLTYSNGKGTLTIDLQDELTYYRNFEVNNISTIIFTKQFEGTSLGYFHLYVNSSTKSVYLDININSLSNEEHAKLDWANTNGLRKVDGLTCKINNGDAFTSL